MFLSDERVFELIKKYGSPSAQTSWGGDVSSKSVAITEQQITVCYYGHRCYYCIKHQIERIFPDLIVHA